MVPQSPISDSFVDITEEALLEKIPPNLLQGSDISLKNWKSKDPDLISYPGTLWKFLFGESLGGRSCCKISEHVEGLVSTSNVDMKKNRYILLTTIRTNGFAVDAMVVDTLKPKTRASAPIAECPLVGCEKKRKRARMQSDVVTPADFENAKTVVGVDAGEVFAIGACAKSLRCYSVDERGHLGQIEDAYVTNLGIKTKALFEPEHLHKRWLEHQKTEVNTLFYIRKSMSWSNLLFVLPENLRWTTSSDGTLRTMNYPPFIIPAG